MGLRKAGIPWVTWDSHGYENKISHGMGMGWELRRGSGKILHSTWSKDSILWVVLQPETVMFSFEQFKCL